uniref:Uncharacterized protein n=1 Tax=Amphimedon queenslandica TaxID=400682 RepID=A0A1X7UYU4_AMPQE
MCWDFTCPDTLAPSYVTIAATAGGSAAALAEEHKITKYSHLSPSYLFTPLSIETMGAVGPKSSRFLKELGGTDIISCFAGQNLTLPEHKGEIQFRNMGMAVEWWDRNGKPVYDERGDFQKRL